LYLPEINRGDIYILTMIDSFTRIAEAVAVKTKSMENIARIIEENIFKKYGVPRVILSDNGTEFKNVITKELSERYGFE
jgi:transposase InsO family protein